MPKTVPPPLETERRAANAHSIITSFTPSIMGEAMLRDIFVARQPLLDRLVRNIREATTSEARRHALLVGPRGIGKTHLVSMVYYAVQDDLELRNDLRIAWLREEEWSIFSYADLLVQVFRALANEYPDNRQHLTQVADQLRRLPIDEGAIVGEAQLLEFLGDRLLLIIAENVNDIFEGMGEQGQQSLRAFLQNHSRALLLTTAPALSADLSEHDAPFYGFFNTTHLQELTRAEARELLIHVAELDGPNTELVAYLKTDEADRRLRVIETLAGGHPRIWILFSACMSQKLLDELVPLFIKMLDDLTPYYQERMRTLAPQERRIISYLCEQRGAAPVKEIAEACRLKQNATAALLGKLEEKAFVRKAAEPTAPSTGDRRVTFYEMREPLMRLCLEVKANRAQPLELIVDFLRLWFHEHEIIERLFSIARTSRLTATYLRAALIRIAEMRNETAPLILEAAKLDKSGQQAEALNLYDHILTFDPNNELIWFVRALTLNKLERYHEAFESLQRAGHIFEEFSFGWFIRGQILTLLKRYAEAADRFRRAISLDPGDANSHVGLFLSILKLRQLDEAAGVLEFFLIRQTDQGDALETLTQYMIDGLIIAPDLCEHWQKVIDSLASNFSEYRALAVLGRALTKYISDLVDDVMPLRFADHWLAAWEQASLGHPEMDVAMRILRAAVEWKHTRDRGAILRLAAEERVILESLLPKS